ncbi:MAG: hypothetical protein ACMXYA_03015 [Candidatus Woesearchaeota archaeon]
MAKSQKTSRNLQLGGAIAETVLAIPIIGGTIILGLAWYPLFILFIYHIITLVFSAQESTRITGPVLGIVASVVGIIPFVGWVLHVLAAIFLYIGALKK